MSRLRNRIRKADYFTDGELLRWPRDKRTTYSGLWAMAEDSGCLEDDCFEWKMTIWPSPLDADITVEMLEQWRNELTEAGKLVPYEGEGKRYLFIRNFHQHERPTNPQRPDLPLPPWVAAEITEGRSKDQKKWSRCQYTVSADDVPTRDAVCADLHQQRTQVCTDGEVSTDSVQTQIHDGLRSPVLSCPVLSEVEEPPYPPQPVDNFADQQRGCSIEHEEDEPEPPADTNGDGAADSHAATSDNVGTCDGKPCPAHDFPASAFAPLRRAMLVSLHPEQQKEVGTKGDLDALLESYAAHVCAACQDAFGEFERPQLDGMCEQAVVAAVANLHGSQDVTAVMKSRLLRFGLAELIGDRKLEELRRTKRDKRRKGEPVRVGATLPPIERVEEEAS